MMTRLQTLAAIVTVSGGAAAQTADRAGFLQDLYDGKIPKSQVELVLVQHSEDKDVAWSNPLKSVRTVYCQGSNCDADSIELTSEGPEGLPFLHHIAANYDDLSTWTIFTHAGGRLASSLSSSEPDSTAVAGDLQEYLRPADGSFFPLDGKVHVPSLLRSRHFTAEIDTTPAALEVATRPSHCLQDQQGSSWSEYLDVPDLRAKVASQCGIEEVDWWTAFQTFWDEHVGLQMPPHQVLHYSESLPLEFAISRDRLQQRPKAFYERLLNLLSNRDSCLETMLHFAWQYIFGMPMVAACAATSADAAVEATAIGMATDGSGSQDLVGGPSPHIAALTRALRSISGSSNDTDVRTETIWNITGAMHFYARDANRLVYVGNDTLSNLAKAWMGDHLNISSDWLTWTWTADEDWSLLLICDLEIVFPANMATAAQNTLATLTDISFISLAAEAFEEASGVKTSPRGVRFVLGSVVHYLPTDLTEADDDASSEGGTGEPNEEGTTTSRSQIEERKDKEDEKEEDEKEEEQTTTSQGKKELHEDSSWRSSCMAALIVAFLSMFAAL